MQSSFSNSYFPLMLRSVLAVRVRASSGLLDSFHVCNVSSNPLDALTRTAKTERSMSGKYELLKEDCIEYDGRTLYRIRALRDLEALSKATWAATSRKRRT